VPRRVGDRCARSEGSAAEAHGSRHEARELTGAARGDLAAGWKLAPPHPKSPPCTTEPNESKLVQTAKVDPTFIWKDGVTSLGSEVDIFKTDAQAKADWRLSTLKLFRACLLENARSQLGKTFKVRIASAKSLSSPAAARRPPAPLPDRLRDQARLDSGLARERRLRARQGPDHHRHALLLGAEPAAVVGVERAPPDALRPPRRRDLATAAADGRPTGLAAGSAILDGAVRDWSAGPHACGRR
jgi:hypothetical protein